MTARASSDRHPPALTERPVFVTPNREDTQMPVTKTTTKPVAEVTKVGNLTRDPVLKFADTGRAYAHTAMAVESPGPDNDWKNKTVAYYDLTVFGPTAEHVCESLAKGARVIVIGKPEVKEYETAEGEKRTGKSIAVNHIGADLRFAVVVVSKVRDNRTEDATPEADPGTGELFNEEPF